MPENRDPVGLWGAAARAALFVVSITTLVRAADPSAFIALHPENPRYFVWRGKPVLLVTSGEHYGAVLNLDFDYVAYLDELQSHGLNHTRAFSGIYREDRGAFGITDNTLAPQPNRYICPWARSGEPAYRDGGNRFDLTRYDDAYFARLKDFLAQADRRGIVVELNLFRPMYEDSMWVRRRSPSRGFDLQLPLLRSTGHNRPERRTGQGDRRK
ncbi:MAG: hypothetical protein FJ297_18970 [Planctomycetes bacterium]|nr:hypothetical protein [Planctomycetota bacterium]